MNQFFMFYILGYRLLLFTLLSVKRVALFIALRVTSLRIRIDTLEGKVVVQSLHWLRYDSCQAIVITVISNVCDNDNDNILYSIV